MFAAVKRNLRCMNLQRSSTRTSVNFLSAAWLHKNPGLEGVAKGVQLHMEHNADKVAPNKAYFDLKWLGELESMG